MAEKTYKCGRIYVFSENEEKAVDEAHAATCKHPACQ